MTVLKDYNLVTGIRKVFRGTPVLSLTPEGRIEGNKAFIRRMNFNNSTYCFIYLKSQKQIAFKFVTNRQPFTVKACNTKKGPVRIYIRSFLCYIKYELPKRQKNCNFRISDDENVVLIDLP